MRIVSLNWLIWSVLGLMAMTPQGAQAFGQCRSETFRVAFASGSSALTLEAQRTLESDLRKSGDCQLRLAEVVAFGDSRQSQASSMALAKRRAATTLRLLARHHIPPAMTIVRIGSLLTEAKTTARSNISGKVEVHLRVRQG